MNDIRLIFFLTIKVYYLIQNNIAQFIFLGLSSTIIQPRWCGVLFRENCFSRGFTSGAILLKKILDYNYNNYLILFILIKRV
ncbi:MAG: hypothetical protein CMG74_04530 [Candidatus Marinimicrobia bacterium]|nr:hypothetical protein [Candidatus Neomarinimicrobiota bacterium]